MSEQRANHAQNTVDFLDQVSRPDILASPENRKEFILNLDPAGFQKWLTKLNALARGLDPHQHEIDGHNVEVPSLMPPEPEDKELLLEATLRGAQEILSHSTDTQEALEDVSLLFSGAINYIHPFNDGNGRTSRVAGFLTKEGYDGSSESQEKLISIMGDRGKIIFQNNPGMITPWLNNRVIKNHRPEKATGWPLFAKVDGFADEEIGEEALFHLSESSMIKAEKIMRDHDLGELAATKIMVDRGLMPETADFGDKNFAWIEPKDYFAKFSDEDIESVMQESRAMRKERIEYFIQAIVDPDSFPIQLTENSDEVHYQDRESTLKDYYMEVFLDNSKLYTERNALQRRRDQRIGRTVATAA